MAMHPEGTETDRWAAVGHVDGDDMVFAEIAADVRAAIEALRASRLDAAADHVDRAAGHFDRATVPPRTGSAVRPGHAGGSEHYERFENLCGLPTAPGDAHDTVVRAYLDLRRSVRFDEAEWNRFRSALAGLEEQHQRWKSECLARPALPAAR
ncbi:hypothetical protein [Streptomyces xanthophaeus]|uniref:hypothetical protein n=1 Tax=Streptomyces xanthophaeus TaxID=67385 RepID=UPI0026492594|nr:hypothetical protein [Streptomyces xanthophaeus]WKD30672.1 hypothetical protein KO717_00925 [Streptomyces xanthophaeus]